LRNGTNIAPMPSAQTATSLLRGRRAVMRWVFSEVARKTREPTASRIPTVVSPTP
jgi:hypothetical protein